MIIKRIAPLSAGKVLGALYALFGLIAGGIFSLISLVGGAALHSAMSSDSSPVPSFVSVFIGAGAVIIVPIVYGAIGFIGGIISAALYNLCASVVGGMKLDIETEQPRPQTYSASAAGY